jgi:hypothetical protein
MRKSAPPARKAAGVAQITMRSIEAVQLVEVEQRHRIHVPVAVVEHGHGEGLGHHPAHLDRACEVDERLRDVEAVLGRARVDYEVVFLCHRLQARSGQR